MIESQRVAVFVEPTPNPNSLKFIAGREIIADGATHEFASADQARESSLARRIFEIPGVEGVFIGRDFVSVRKSAAASWDQIEPRTIEVIEEEVSSGRPVVAPSKAASASGASGAEIKIRRILDEEIRPAVASDGGDVVFQSFNEGVLTLRLVGACSGCPSSTMTLKMGIERRLMEDIPELREVVSVM